MSQNIEKFPQEAKGPPVENHQCCSNNKIWHLLVKHSQWARHCSKYITCINLFKPQNNTLKQVYHYYYGHYINKEAKTQRGMWFLKVPPLETDIRQFGSRVHDFYRKALPPFCGKEESYAKALWWHMPWKPSGAGERALGTCTRSLNARPEAPGEC